jgi:hypothetical protein
MGLQGKLANWQDHYPSEDLQSDMPVHQRRIFGKAPIASRSSIVMRRCWWIMMIHGRIVFVAMSGY